MAAWTLQRVGCDLPWVKMPFFRCDRKILAANGAILPMVWPAVLLGPFCVLQFYLGQELRADTSVRLNRVRHG